MCERKPRPKSGLGSWYDSNRDSLMLRMIERLSTLYGGDASDDVLVSVRVGNPGTSTGIWMSREYIADAIHQRLQHDLGTSLPIDVKLRPDSKRQID